MAHNIQPNRGLRFFIGVLVALVLAEAAGGALLVESLRQQGARHAGIANQLERDLMDAGRRERSVEAELALALHPDVLKTRIGTRMASPLAKQMVWVRPAAPATLQPKDGPMLPAVTFRIAQVEVVKPEDQLR